MGWGLTHDYISSSFTFTTNTNVHKSCSDIIDSAWKDAYGIHLGYEGGFIVQCSVDRGRPRDVWNQTSGYIHLQRCRVVPLEDHSVSESICSDA